MCLFLAENIKRCRTSMTLRNPQSKSPVQCIRTWMALRCGLSFQKIAWLMGANPLLYIGLNKEEFYYIYNDVHACRDHFPGCRYSVPHPHIPHPSLCLPSPIYVPNSSRPCSQYESFHPGF